MFSPVAEDVQAIARDLRLDTDIAFTRLAVTPAQIAALGLPTMPPKPTDRRSFSGETTQAEAIAPNVLADIIRGAIEERLDRATYDFILNAEMETRIVLSARLRPLLQEYGD
jgi:hypothetical protein